MINILISAFLIGMDQLLKWLAVKYVKPVGIVPLIPKVVEFQYVENDGMAFSLLAGKQIFLIILSLIAILVLAYILFVKKPKNKVDAISLLLIFSGGIGNLIDRIVNRYVVDYINVLFVPFAVFNLADILVVVGVFMFLISMIYTEIKNTKKAKAELQAEHTGEESHEQPD